MGSETEMQPDCFRWYQSWARQSFHMPFAGGWNETGGWLERVVSSGFPTE